MDFQTMLSSTTASLLQHVVTFGSKIFIHLSQLLRILCIVVVDPIKHCCSVLLWTESFGFFSIVILLIMVVPDFTSSRSRTWPSFGNPALAQSLSEIRQEIGPNSSGPISCRISLIPVQSITNKTTVCDLSSGIFTLLISSLGQ